MANVMPTVIMNVSTVSAYIQMNVIATKGTYSLFIHQTYAKLIVKTAQMEFVSNRIFASVQMDLP